MGRTSMARSDRRIERGKVDQTSKIVAGKRLYSEVESTSDESVKHVSRPRYRRHIEQDKVDETSKSSTATENESSSNESEVSVCADFSRGDIINYKYKIISKLGEGTFGKVWKALDVEGDYLVALKIAKRCKENAHSEVDILRKIAEIETHGKKLWVEMFDTFNYQSHIGISFELLGCSIYKYLKFNNYEPFPIIHIRQIMYQLCFAVKLLHDNGIIHTDLKTSNVVFIYSDYSTSFTRDGRRLRILKNTALKVIDFGSAILPTESHNYLIQTAPYRAPEVYARCNWNMSVDVWSLGCILFELYTGSLLFPIRHSIDSLTAMEQVLGPMPAMYSERYQSFSGKSRSTSRTSQNCFKPLKEYMVREDKDHQDLFDLMRKMLHYDPKQRISLAEALQHCFFV